MDTGFQKKNQDCQELLSVHNLKTYFYDHHKVIKALDGIDFKIKKNEILGMVGESGAGKSVCALSISRLLSASASCKITGKVIFNQVNLLELNEKKLQNIRGSKISMIFQEPGTSLNPVLTVGKQIAETIKLHHKLSNKDSWEKAIEMLRLVKISEPAKRVREYPHEMSGGMKQRVMIAMALSTNPSLLIADEPTTALDVTTQKQVLSLIKELQRKFGTAVLFITHNLGVIAEVADRIIVMYAGRALEYADVNDLFHFPGHPYTLSLLKSIPRLDAPRGTRLKVTPGSLPKPTVSISGCLFHPRCKYVISKCKVQEPGLFKVDEKHFVRCWKYHETESGNFDESKNRYHLNKFPEGKKRKKLE